MEAFGVWWLGRITWGKFRKKRVEGLVSRQTYASGSPGMGSWQETLPTQADVIFA